MENENVKVVVETLATSLNNTQKNATDTENSVKQILSMSGKEMHEMTVTAILADDKLEMAEKLELIHRESADYDQHQENNTIRVVRLQNTKTQNVGKAAIWWGENWGWVTGCTVVVIALVTPGVRKLLSSATKLIAA